MKIIFPLALLLLCCACAGRGLKPATGDMGVGETVSAEETEKSSPKRFLDGHEFLIGSDSVFGMVLKRKVGENESLIEIARLSDLGFNEISDANPGTDPFIPPAGSDVLIPAEWVLPEMKVRQGIIINISERRLYFFPTRNSDFVYTFPIGIGDDGKETPVGRFRIIQKIASPSWHVPPSIKVEDPELPDVVPPGPDNPLGSHALRLSAPGILIHGTNRPWGIGRKVSHGCIHLYPEDIPWLFDHVKKGTRVTIVEQPVKVGTRGNRVYLEVHDVGKLNYRKETMAILARMNLSGKVDSRRIDQAIRKKDGIPVVISK